MRGRTNRLLRTTQPQWKPAFRNNRGLALRSLTILEQHHSHTSTYPQNEVQRLHQSSFSPHKGLCYAEPTTSSSPDAEPLHHFIQTSAIPTESSAYIRTQIAQQSYVSRVLSNPSSFRSQYIVRFLLELLFGLDGVSGQAHAHTPPRRLSAFRRNRYSANQEH